MVGSLASASHQEVAGNLLVAAGNHQEEEGTAVGSRHWVEVDSDRELREFGASVSASSWAYESSGTHEVAHRTL